MGEIKNNQDSLFFNASYITNFPDDFMKALLFALLDIILVRNILIIQHIFILIRITTKDSIQIFDPAKIFAYGSVFYRAFMLFGILGFVPRTNTLRPVNVFADQINIHVCTAQLSDFFVHACLIFLLQKCHNKRNYCCNKETHCKCIK